MAIGFDEALARARRVNMPYYVSTSHDFEVISEGRI